jgi:RimJ/RimL family protein N-acetyltransferase
MNRLKELETERLVIRPFNKTDEEGFILFMTNPSITNNLAFDDSLKSKEGALAILNQTIESYNTEHPLLAFAIADKITGSFMGACGITFLKQDVAEVFYAFFPDCWGKGFATEVLSKLIDYLAQIHTVKEIHAFITPQNVASIKVVEKFGFLSRGMTTKDGFSDQVLDYVLSL